MFGGVRGMVPGWLKLELRRTGENVLESAEYLFMRQEPLSGDIFHVVFVCQGNICRSAFAEHYLRASMGEGVLKIESCGLESSGGSPSPPDAIQVGREFGVDLTEHQSRKVTDCSLVESDLILTMEFRHYLRLIGMFPERKHKIRLLRDFAPWPERLMPNIYDPYGLGENEFRRCFLSIGRAVEEVKRRVMGCTG